MNNLKIGDKISVPGRVPPIRHVGIYVGNGRVIHNSYDDGGVIEDSMARFSGGYDPEVDQRARAGFDQQVVARARKLLGTKYNLLTWNCEHLATYATEGQAWSPTARLAVAGLVVLLGGGAMVANSGWDANAGRYRRSNGQFAPNWF